MKVGLYRLDWVCTIAEFFLMGVIVLSGGEVDVLFRQQDLMMPVLHLRYISCDKVVWTPIQNSLGCHKEFV